MLSYLPLTPLEFLNALQMGLIFSIVTLGVYLSFRVLDFPDMTVNGTFPMGAGIAAVLVLGGTNPWLACLVAMCGGACAGIVTAWFTTRWKILHLLSSILTVTALYSVNLRIMGGPNLTLFSMDTIFTPLERCGVESTSATLLLVGITALAVLVALRWFLMSEIGLAMRATGKNPRMALAQGVRVKGLVMSGIALSNALVALGGAIYAQAIGFADIAMGADVIIVGLAAVLLGEAVMPGRRLVVALGACVVGSILYRVALAMALNSDILGLQPSDLQLANAALIGLAMILSQLKKPLKGMQSKGAKS